MAKRKRNKRGMPKRLLGVKIPKSVRKAGWSALLTSPIGAGIISSVVTAAVAASAARATQPGGRIRRAAHTAGDGVEQAGSAVTRSTSAFAFALGEASRTFLETLRSRRALGDAAELADEAAPPLTATPSRKAAPAEAIAGAH